MVAVARPLLVVLALLAAAPAAAYRPFDGTDADVAGLGELEIELGPAQYLYARPGHSLIAPALILNLGVIRRVELVLEGKQVVALADTGGPRLQLRDTGFYVKTVLREGCLQDGSGPSVATEIGPLLPEVTLRRGAAGAGESDAGPRWLGASAAVIVSQRASAGTAHLNVAGFIPREGTFDLFGGLILEGPARWRLRPVAEVWVQHEFLPHVPPVAHEQRTSVSGLAGAIWKVRDGLTVDAGVRVAGEEGVFTVEVRAGLTDTFDLWHPHRPDSPHAGNP